MKSQQGSVELLLSKMADIKIKDKTGLIALHYAAKSGDQDICRLFIERGIV